MATTDQVSTGLDSIAATMAGSRNMLANAKVGILNARNQISSLPTEQADVIATIQGFTPTGAYETLKKDELARLTTEFLALKSTLEDVLDLLGVSYS